MSNETANKQDDAPNASAIKDCLTRLVSYPIVQFYRIEAKMWRALYQQQRGGKAFDDMQKELAETKRKLFSANNESRHPCRNQRIIMKTETSNKQDDTENASAGRNCPGSLGSIAWLRWRRPVTYKWTYGPYSIVYHEAGYWNLRLQKQLLFSHEDLQVVQEWAANYIKLNTEHTDASR